MTLFFRVVVAGFTLFLISGIGVGRAHDTYRTQLAADDQRSARENFQREYEKFDQKMKRELERMVEEGKHGKKGATPLWMASFNNNLEEVKRLLDSGVDINAKDKDGETALMQASLKGHLEVVKLLLAKGAEINASDNHGNTALMKALDNGKLEAVNLLVDEGTDINAANEDGETALMQASKMGRLEVTKRLVDKKANVNAKNKESETALWLAAACGKSKIVKLLFEQGADLNCQQQDYGTPLMWASLNGDVPMVKLLLDKGAEVNAQNKYGETALTMASSAGHTEVVKLLRAHGAGNKPTAATIDREIPSEMSCYEVGYRAARCTWIAISGGKCDPQDNIIIPDRCSLKDMEAGKKAALKDLSSKSVPLEEVMYRLINKAKQICDDPNKDPEFNAKFFRTWAGEFILPLVKSPSRHQSVVLQCTTESLCIWLGRGCLSEDFQKIVAQTDSCVGSTLRKLQGN